MRTFSDFRILMQVKRYSANTIKSYIGLLRVFDAYIGDEHEMHRLDVKHLFQLIREFIITKKYVYATQKQFLSALKLYMNEIHKIPLDIETLSPRKPQQVLPDILSNEEISALIKVTTNIKHKAMLVVLYSLGLRSGELINLEVTHLDGKRNVITIKKAKGQKDRILPFPESIKPLLREYYKKYTPKRFLFEGRNHKKYSPASLRAVFNKAVHKANIEKEVTPHSLRHAFATHLLESGTNLKIIQQLLGHNDIKTTMLYTQVSNRSILNVQSPIDFIKLDEA